MDGRSSISLEHQRMKKPNNKYWNSNDIPIRNAIKHGLATGTTIDRLTGFEPHVRYRGSTDAFDSV